MKKLEILTAGARYDAACTSSGAACSHVPGRVGNTSNTLMGCCHSFSADGRCVTLLKVLMSNQCAYDCAYCVNRRSKDGPRATFEPEELARLTMEFYRRNYIEGLFLSSGVLVSPDYTMERMIRCLSLLRNEHRFNGYIHAKAIPGADPALVRRLGLLADRISVNIELPSERSLLRLAPDKSRHSVLAPMGFIDRTCRENKEELARFRHTPRFAPAGQSTQMIIGATPESDRQILLLSQGLYEKYRLRRVFYSAYVPVSDSSLLPSPQTKPPLLREHRLYQADWLLRFYGFTAQELLAEDQPNFHPLLDPKCHWALCHPELFPVEVNRADRELLLRVPGMGPRSVARILVARQTGPLHFDQLKRLGVVLKRAQYFITCGGKVRDGLRLSAHSALRSLIDQERAALFPGYSGDQLSLFDPAESLPEEVLAWSLPGN